MKKQVMVFRGKQRTIEIDGNDVLVYMLDVSSTTGTTLWRGAADNKAELIKGFARWLYDKVS